ncbi:DNA repair protein RadA [Plantibacter sp. VKM Ac-2885]|jgi:DNA repair protein RadA/Sms|uniref:DNA repair protein RadA n=1 Tax=Plantibacter flavus TaxID=150123 RepID=A0A3N2C019_9MICO|nr:MULTISPECIES: DNA repair protein RadA [Plantibacter]MBD8536651.1 DNA repair protein RadA [Plantibacter sp. CFBP 13570]MBF4512055.1 DNA repair protein RadA [Plantibacter sp. VKM Ac-2885]ROR80831.1 DNA repair protein RadA/Sms [Plantibacter flavus]SMG05550.1 DNA repair protein RadA/Sms [Plantibacter flavus]
MAKAPSPAFRCTECGWTTAKWAGRCGECQQWGTVVEASAPTGVLGKLTPIRATDERAARPITQASADEAPRWSSGIAEFDRVLGGGIVPGAAILLSGEPGVGKSTLLLEVASRAAKTGARVLYVSAEESVSQVRLRAERTGALHDDLYLASETDLATILGHIDQVQPKLLIVDSVQTVSSSQSDGLAGQPGQVREVSAVLTRIAKERDLPVLLVGHVTKDGSIAGPRLLEHLVDVVCQFEGDRHTALRFLRAQKNRFGATDEVGCFEMAGDGIAEVPDPSALFLSQNEPVAGTCVTIVMEGRRALPVEVQALINKTQAPNPRRVTNGVDPSRVAMILAVLHGRYSYDLTDHDVYISTVGGVKISEPAADLAIALALVSVIRDLALPRDLAAYGEISLSGEVRPVSVAKQRGSEGNRLGYKLLLNSDVSNDLKSVLGIAKTAAEAARPARRERELDAAF